MVTLYAPLTSPSNVLLVMFVTPSPLNGPVGAAGNGGVVGGAGAFGSLPGSFSLSMNVTPLTCRPTESNVIRPLASPTTFRLPWIKVFLMIVVCEAKLKMSTSFEHGRHASGRAGRRLHVERVGPAGPQGNDDVAGDAVHGDRSQRGKARAVQREKVSALAGDRVLVGRASWRGGDHDVVDRVVARDHHAVRHAAKCLDGHIDDAGEHLPRFERFKAQRLRVAIRADSSSWLLCAKT